LAFVTDEARENGEEVEYEVASEIMPGRLAEGSVISIYFEK
jgi:hypothetical protein